MSTPLNVYKTATVNALISAYNQNVASIQRQYNNLVSNINKSNTSVKIKKITISRLNAERNSKLVALKTTLKSNITAVMSLTQIPGQPTPPPVPPAVQSKRAVLFGINYVGTPNELNGCINDVNNISTVLINSFGYTSPNIRIITDYTANAPTRHTILSELTTLLSKSNSGDSAFFYYSGHGTNMADSNGDEIDGQDECIVPVDLNIITDDELKQLITTYLKTGVSLVAIFDSCFSGTIMDLKYNYLSTENGNALFVNDKNAETVGNLIVISGCMDSQTSADAYINGKYNGALTWSILNAFAATDPKTFTWDQLITRIREELVGEQFDQIPQLSSGKQLNIESKIQF